MPKSPRRRALFLVLAGLALCGPLRGQDGEAGAPFPILPVIETSRLGRLDWRPDWPLSIPPDAFSVPGNPRAVILAAGGEEYVLRRDGRGNLRAFPFPFGDSLCNVSFTGGGPATGEISATGEVSAEGEISAEGEVSATGGPAGYGGFSVSPASGAESAGPFWIVEFLEYSDDGPPLPRVCRLSSGGAWFFAVIDRRGPLATETWFAGDGTALGVFSYLRESWADPGEPRLRLQSWDGFAPGGSPGTDDSGEVSAEGAAPPLVPGKVEFFYDSFGNVSALRLPGAEYSALFRSSRPLYWTRPPQGLPAAGTDVAQAEFHALQWDERGLLVRLSGTDREGALLLAIRYDYVLDGRGLWVERRGTVLSRRGGFLVPAAAERFSRRVEYEEDGGDGRF